MPSLEERARAPVDGASLAAFRIAFGGIMVWEVWRYFRHGWIARYWVEPDFHFTYFGFGWVQPWPEAGLVAHWAVLGALGALIALGLLYRAAALLFFLGFTYAFLLEQARYLNHFYFIALLSLLLVFVPAHRTWSLDALRRSGVRSGTVPAAAVWLLRAQVGIVYLYAGIAKLNADWLTGEPMATWLARRTQDPLLGAVAQEEWVALVGSYGALGVDLLVVPALLWRPTRAVAFGVATLFHLGNWWLFSIGAFPWLMIAATTLFFEPDWPRGLLRRARGLLRRARGLLLRRPRAAERSDRRPAEGGGRRAAEGGLRVARGIAPRARGATWRARPPVVSALVLAWVLVQALVPLRHHLYPGPPAWTEEGHRFSWRMLLRTKRAVEVDFLVTDRRGRMAWRVDPSEHLRPWQARKAFTRPDMILQYAHFLAAEVRKSGWEDVEVRADVRVSLNGREARPLVDPERDLAAVPRTLGPADWILPLDSREEEARPARAGR